MKKIIKFWNQRIVKFSYYVFSTIIMTFINPEAMSGGYLYAYIFMLVPHLHNKRREPSLEIIKIIILSVMGYFNNLNYYLYLFFLPYIIMNIATAYEMYHEEPEASEAFDLYTPKKKFHTTKQ